MAGTDRKPFLLRIDPKLWVELETWAQQDLRSVNGQIEFILREAVKRRRGAGSPPASDDSAAAGDTVQPDTPPS